MVTDNPAENRADVFIPGAWLGSPVITAARRKKKLVERDVMARIVGDLGTDVS
ncbi:hypothetical protein WME79_45995 [Sorangium sp. So ce726]|uniref:hypothetical protein n=1 Tax=Sorangium sp. So ce726 TaxID=3133319 RepID=UPI003F5E9AD1